MSESNIPQYQNPKMPDETLTAANTIEQAAKDLAEARRSGRIMDMPETGLMSYISPTEPNTSFLARPGKIISFPDPNSPTGRRDAAREGDVWADFHGGVCSTRDPVAIDWLEAHSGDREKWLAWHAKNATDPRSDTTPYGLCRPKDMPGVGGWAELKTMQMPTSRRDALLSTNYDADAILAHGFASMRPDPNSIGAGIVQTAETNAAGDEAAYSRRNQGD